MADTKVSDLTALAKASIVIADDLLPIIDVSATTAGSKKATVADVVNAVMDNTKIDKEEFSFDGGGAVLVAGKKMRKWIPYACTITAATIGLDVSGSIVFDVWVDTHANYPPTVADTITAAAKPTVTAATNSQDNTLTGWTTSVPAGRWICVNIDSVSTATQAILTLSLVKT